MLRGSNYSLIAASALILGLAGCATYPIVETNSASTSAPAQPVPETAQVQVPLGVALAVTAKVAPGAGLALGKHAAAVDFRDTANRRNLGRGTLTFAVVSPGVEVPRITSQSAPLESVDIFDALDAVSPGRRDGIALHAAQALLIEGWAFDARAVLIVIDGKRAFSAEYGINRPDVAAYYKSAAYAQSGYEAVVPLGSIGPGAHTVAIVVIGKNGTVYSPSAKASIQMSVS